MFLNSCLLFIICLIKILINFGDAARPWPQQQRQHRPNIVIIIADDMGFDDVSFRGSNEFLTPHIDALAFSGVIFKNFYTPAMCTPSRAALLTGKYPIHTGMQHYVIANYQPWSLPVNETTMAQIFQRNGYFTSLIGKWHLGMSRKKYTPTYRGFDQHFGYLGSYVDYFDHTLYSPYKSYARGHDFRRNLAVTHEHKGVYATDVINDAAVRLINEHDFVEKPLMMILSHLAPHSGNEDKPLQAPDDEIEKFSYIANADRRTYAAMMSSLDKSVGHVIDALNERGVLNDTILLFFSDNGGPTLGDHGTTASNYPLKGQKNSPWEGGLRSSAAIWSTQLKNPGSTWSQHIYIADLLPTLAKAASIELDSTLGPPDGLDLWEAILKADDNRNFQREIVHNIDDLANYVSYSMGGFKYINGTTLHGKYDYWLSKRPNPKDTNANDPRAGNYEKVIKATSVWQQLQALNQNGKNYVNVTALRSDMKVNCMLPMLKSTGASCMPMKAPCLFDLQNDPCEQFNLFEAAEHQPLLEHMIKRIEFYRSTAHIPNNKPEDRRCDPRHYQNEWTWWEDIQDELNNGGEKAAVQSFKILLGLGFTVVLTKRYLWFGF